MNDPTINYAIVGIIILIVLFFALRELMLWYWKINSIEKLLKEQNIYLKRIANKYDPEGKNKSTTFTIDLSKEYDDIPANVIDDDITNIQIVERYTNESRYISIKEWEKMKEDGSYKLYKIKSWSKS